MMKTETRLGQCSLFFSLFHDANHHRRNRTGQNKQNSFSAISSLIYKVRIETDTWNAGLIGAWDRRKHCLEWFLNGSIVIVIMNLFLFLGVWMRKSYVRYSWHSYKVIMNAQKTCKIQMQSSMLNKFMTLKCSLTFSGSDKNLRT